LTVGDLVAVVVVPVGHRRRVVVADTPAQHVIGYPGPAPIGDDEGAEALGGELQIQVSEKAADDVAHLGWRVRPVERDGLLSANEGWKQHRICGEILSGLKSEGTTPFDVGEQDPHRLRMDGDGALGMGLGVLDVQAAEPARWLTDSLIDPNGASDSVNIGPAEGKRFTEPGAGVGKAGK
jgi:hypothetical protein